MRIHDHYLMRDQVKGLIPELMQFDSRGSRRTRGSFTELLMFVGALTAYLAALAISS